MDPARRARLAAGVAAIVVAMSLWGPATAGAATRSFGAVRASHGVLVFKVGGVEAPRVRSAQLRVGRYRRTVKSRLVRRAARRGVLRLRAPRLIRRWRRLLRRSRHSGRSARSAVRPRLVIRVAQAARVYPCSVPQGARYVSPSGSDSGPGTAATPWRTLDKALEEAGPGETVVLKAGTYGARGTTAHVARGGTAGAPVSIVGEPGGPRPRVLGQFRVSAD